MSDKKKEQSSEQQQPQPQPQPKPEQTVKQTKLTFDAEDRGTLEYGENLENIVKFNYKEDS
jgi:hypothetical protein